MGFRWSKIGCQPKVMAKQKRRERKTGIGSYNYGSGQITVSLHDKGNYKSFSKKYYGSTETTQRLLWQLTTSDTITQNC